MTKKLPNTAGTMIVIHLQILTIASGLMRTTYSASAVLRGEHGLILLDGKAMTAFQIICARFGAYSGAISLVAFAICRA